MEHGHHFVRTPDPVYLATKDDAEYWADRVGQQPALGFDTETTGLSKHGDRVKFFSFSDGANRFCGPLRLLRPFEPVLVNPEIEKRMSNAKFDMHMAANHGIIVRGRVVDTVVLDWYLDENRQRHGLKETAKDYLGLRMPSFRETFPKVKGVQNEGDTVAWFHDILESGNEDRASEALVALKRADGDEDVIDALQSLYLSKQGGYVLSPRQLAATARLQRLCAPHAGTNSWVADCFDVLGYDMPDTERRVGKALLEADRGLVQELHTTMVGRLWKYVKVDLVPLEMLQLNVADYASLDAWASYQLVDFLREQLGGEDEGGGYTVLDRVEEEAIPYTRVLWNMERRGFPIDADQCRAYGTKMKEDLGRIERNLVAAAGKDFNPRSPDQLRGIFYQENQFGQVVDKLGDAPTRWTKGGESGNKQPSTDEETLTGWAERGVKLAEILLEHRELEKLNGTYFEGLPTWLDPRGRIMTDLKQGGARTGRLSSAEPNLTNQPAKGDWGRNIRRLFIPGVWGDCDPMLCVDELRNVPVPCLDPDTPMCLLVADYDQLEVKLAAEECQDEHMCSTLNAGKDIHCQTSATITGIAYEDFVAAKKAAKAKTATPDQVELVDIRDKNKSALFGIFFGIGEVKLGGQLKLPILRMVMRNGKTRETCPEARKIIDGVFATYPGLRVRIEKAHADTARDLFIRNLTGRIRRLPDILSVDKILKSLAQRQSFNFLTQGGGADIVKAAMIKAEHCAEMRMLGARMLLQVHDEIIWEIPAIDEFIDPIKAKAKQYMEHPFQRDLSVPLTVSMQHGPSWGAAKG